jgi:hypothetical protein
MTLRRCLSFALTLLMFGTIGVAPLSARPRSGWKEYSIPQLRLAMRALGTGPEARVTVRLCDKTTFSGFLSQVGPSRFLVIDAQTTLVIPVIYEDVKELRGENLVDGVQFAARVGFTPVPLEVAQEPSNLPPEQECCEPKGGLM